MSSLICSWEGCEEEAGALTVEIRPRAGTGWAAAKPNFSAETTLCPPHLELLKILAQSIVTGDGGEQWHWDQFTVYPE